MAISPKAVYPGQTDDTDPDYPLGKARNATTLGDGTGFPIERRWVNDLFGFQQALLDAAGITITANNGAGEPDKVGASQYLEALDALYYRQGLVDGMLAAEQLARENAIDAEALARENADADLNVRKVEAGSAKYVYATSQHNPLELTADFADDGFEVISDTQIKPGKGRYLVSCWMQGTSNNASVKVQLHFIALVNGNEQARITGLRPDDDPSSSIYVMGSMLLDLDDEDVLEFRAQASTGTLGLSSNAARNISIVRVSAPAPEE